METQSFRRRSFLYVPGSSQRMLAKSLDLVVDAVIFDLEDSVSPEQKDQARSNVCTVLADSAPRLRDMGKEIIVRVNQLDSAYAWDDLSAVVPHQPDSVLVTKVTPRIVIAADVILSLLEAKHGLGDRSIGLIALVETAEGVDRVAESIAASNRLNAVQFGAEDFTRDMAIRRTDGGGEIQYSRNRLAVACKAGRIDCIDTPYADFKNLEGYERDTLYAKAVGMTGRSVIHPSLIPVTNRIFSAAGGEIEYARRVVAAYEEAVRENKGAVALDGKMIDLPVVERARKLLVKAALESE